jgi:hypothetical protein
LPYDGINKREGGGGNQMRCIRPPSAATWPTSSSFPMLPPTQPRSMNRNLSQHCAA